MGTRKCPQGSHLGATGLGLTAALGPTCLCLPQVRNCDFDRRGRDEFGDLVLLKMVAAIIVRRENPHWLMEMALDRLTLSLDSLGCRWWKPS